MIRIEAILEAGRQDEALSALRALGAVNPTIESYVDPEEFTKAYLADYSEYLIGVFAPKEPSVEELVNANYRSLMLKLELLRGENVENCVPEFRVMIQDLLFECTEVNPNKFSFTPTNIRWDPKLNIIRPNHGISLVLDSGLDGVTRNRKQTALERGLSTHIVGIHIATAMGQINNRLNGKVSLG